MAKGYLDGKLECATCGTIRMLIPKKADELTEIHCSSCGRLLGTWGELQDEFAREAGDGTLEFNGGRIRRVEPKRTDRQRNARRLVKDGGQLEGGAMFPAEKQ
ncbi:hypothetical protein EET67_21945 [Pseudaminobacter arsenicus]|uniref:Uncharacterized protein n=1 Tax=Borborobacter arsenicus TaxID=1851146 RepID=A0A432V0C6_9HYPH|nr:hypothetical protein [Pseudaminobacter arsenicus]RUM95629.1 hypothetical protein EET67_21945 [Pseudaminobacter arsenicus]